MKKTYKVINDKIIAKGKGMVNNTYTRYISTADSIFSVFIRSHGHRSKIYEKPMSYIIVDKDQKQIDFFKELLTWDGDLSSLQELLTATEDKTGLNIEPFNINLTVGRISRHDFVDFKKSWQLFKNSKFTFINLDIIKNNKTFLEILYRLPHISEEHQFLRLDFRHDNGEVYKEAINNILHLLFMKSMRNYTTVVELADAENNYIENFAGKLYAEFNPTFCILPWMHIQYKPSGQSKLCCRYDTVNELNEYKTAPANNLSNLAAERANLVIQKTSIEDSFYSNYWNTARTLTEENKDISGCHKCYKEEKSSKFEGISSMRLGSSILYNDGYLHKRPNYTEPTIEFLEVGFGNYCNLACLSCNSTLSTSWHDDEISLNTMVDKKLQRVVFPKLDNLKFKPDERTLKSLKIIKFTGGEPMINPEFTKFIELICTDGHPENISLEIYTNCSYIPSSKLLTDLSKFKNIQLNLSIDAYGRANDYIRYGSVWQADKKQTVSNAIDFWLSSAKQYKNIFVTMSTTLSILNILEMPSLIETWLEKFIADGNSELLYKTADLQHYEGFFKIQPAHDPNYINVNSLPKEFYQDISNWISEYRNSFLHRYPMLPNIPVSIGASLTKLENIIGSATGNVTQANDFLQYLKTMDTIRKNSSEESIPDIVSRVKEYLLTQDKPQQS